jgi:signal transduction histidine kinase
MESLDTNDETSQLKTELAKRDKELAAVLRISRALSRMTDLDDLVRETLAVSLDTIDANAGAFYLYDERIRKLIFRYVLNTERPDAGTVLIGKELEPGQGIAGQVFLTGEAVILDDPAHHPDHLRTVGESTGYITRNMVTLPLITPQGKIIGAMQAINKNDSDFDAEDLDLLTIMASQAVLAIESARLYEEARAATIMHYLGDVSHDIKNLMTPAHTGAQTLESILEGAMEELEAICSDALDEPQKSRIMEAMRDLRDLYPEMIGMVTESIVAAQERVREIADAVKGVIAEPVFEEVVLHEVLHSVVRTLNLVAERKGVKILTHELGEAPTAMLDKKRIYTAFYNLVNNAIPETPEGGSITLRCRCVMEGSFPEGNYILVEVADTGRGMTEEVKSRLFSENAISTKPGGTGLGTRIVKNAIDAHKGEIWVESEAGKGSVFFVKLPLAQV